MFVLLWARPLINLQKYQPYHVMLDAAVRRLRRRPVKVQRKMARPLPKPPTWELEMHLEMEMERTRGARDS